MRTFLLGFLAAIVILPLSAATFLRLGFADVNGDADPPVWEKRFMYTAVHRAIARRGGGSAETPATTDERLVAGGKLYLNGCAGCHGELGKPFEEDRSLYPRAPQLPHIGTQYTEPQIYWIVKHGIRMTAMSAYGRFYSEQELWSIAAFIHQIRSLPPGVRERILAKSVNAAP